MFGEDVGSKDAAVKPPRMSLRRSSTDTSHALNTAKMFKLGIAVHTGYCQGIPMLEYDEKRRYIRMEVDCDINYKLADSNRFKTGRCTSISGSGLSFFAEAPFDPGVAMEVSVIPKNAVTPPMTAYVKVVRCATDKKDGYQIAATIESIKGN